MNIHWLIGSDFINICLKQAKSIALTHSMPESEYASQSTKERSHLRQSLKYFIFPQTECHPTAI
jgi:hypothetical protein